MASALLVAVSSSFELYCEYDKVGWDDTIGPAFTCKVKNLNVTQPKTLITSLRGQQPTPKTSDNVNTFLIFEQICDNFPVGVDKYFKNLEGIAVQKSGLKRITKSDLKPFAKLKSISLYGNKLTALESHLFIYNPNIKLVSVFNNKLKHVFPNILGGLNNLERVYFSSNPCFNEDGLNPERIEQLKCKLIESCPATEEMFQYNELETEKLKLEADSARLKESLDAVSKNFILNRRRFEKAQENYKMLKKSVGSDDTIRCASIKIEMAECEAEKLELKELIQELQVVEIICDVPENSGRAALGDQCKSIGLKVLQPDITIVNVKRKDRVRLSYESIFELLVEHQQTLFLPLNISNFLPRLEKLTVTRSELVAITEEAFVGLNDLVELDLSQNQLSDVRARNFAGLTKLQKIDLSDNKIEFIDPLAFSNLVNLDELRLEGNQLAILRGRIFEHNKNLKTLTLNGNKLNQIASNFFGAWSSQIEILDMTSNVCIDLKYPGVSIIHLTKHFSTKCTVEVVFECRFESQTDYFCHAENVEINMRNVRVSKVKGEHKPSRSNNDVTDLRIVNQTMEIIPQNLGNCLPNLRRVWIENSQLDEISKESFEGLRNIRELTINHNNLKEITEGTFDGFSQLQILDLSFNSIAALAERSFETLTSLRTINLSHNKLTSINAWLIPARNVIEKFNFRQNSLTFIDPRLVKYLKTASLIDFEGNKCMNSKFDESTHDEKKVMEIFGEASFKCFD